MPTLSGRRICANCGQIVIGPCPTCRKTTHSDVDKRRGNSNTRGYDSRWRRAIRPAFLRENPLCVLCGELASVPDHWPETRASLVARGVDDPDAAHRLRALCADCHQRHGLRGA